MQPVPASTANTTNEVNNQVNGAVPTTTIPVQPYASNAPRQPVQPAPYAQTMQPGQPVPYAQPMQPGQPAPYAHPVQPGQPMYNGQPGQPMPPVVQGVPVAPGGAVNPAFMPVPSQFDPAGASVANFGKHLDVLNSCSFVF